MNKFIHFNMSIEITGDLLEADEPIIVQQLNCLCVRPHGLSAVISAKFPYADVYRKRRQLGSRNLAVPEDRGQPGSIVVSKPSKPSKPNQPIVVGLYGQYDYGKPGSSARRSTLAQDNFQLREEWFASSLSELAAWMTKNRMTEVAFPYQIGCGLAGGNWKTYKQMITDFALINQFKVVIYRLK